jgi:hypothetical protein
MMGPCDSRYIEVRVAAFREPHTRSDNNGLTILNATEVLRSSKHSLLVIKRTAPTRDTASL